MLNRLTIAQRLIFAFTFLLVVMGILGYLGFYSVEHFDGALTSSLTTAKNYSTAADLAREAQVSFKKQVQEWKDLLLRGHEEDIYKKYREKFDLEEQQVRATLDTLQERLSQMGQDAAAVQDLLREHAELGQRYRAALNAFNPEDPLNHRKIDALVKGIDRPATQKMDALVEQILKAQTDKVAEAESSARNRGKELKHITLAALLLGAGLAALLALLVTRSITRPLRQVVDAIGRIGMGETQVDLPMGTPADCAAKKNCGKPECPSYGKLDHCWTTSGSFALVKHCPRAQKGEDCRTCDLYGARNEMEELASIVTGLANGLTERTELALALAEGDLTREVPLISERDGLGKALQQMVKNFRDVLGNIHSAGQQIATGASEVADSSQSLSQGATEQASSLEEISASMNELSSQTNLNAENASQANQLSSQTKTSAEEGNRQMQAMVAAMAEINEASENISKIIKVIDEIAFQTNLLALNAAVEAARAGAHGKGFAVVAEEVRTLAARSAKAAKETAELIEGSVKKTQRGAGIADETAAALAGIVTGITKVSDLVGEIAAASNEQAQGIGQVNTGLTQIDQVTQQNTASAEESAAAAEELSSQADQLRQLLQRFKLRESQAAEGRGPRKQQMLSGAQGQKSSADPMRPAPPMIALDDEEFGRY